MNKGAKVKTVTAAGEVRKKGMPLVRPTGGKETCFSATGKASAVSPQMLAAGLRQDELFLAYQPQVDALNGALLGFEALLRWHSASRGPIPPTSFIPVAESGGMIHRVWECVLACVARDQRMLDDRPSLHVAVNLSALQLPRPGLAERFARWLTESAIDAAQVQIEITESALLRKTPALEKNMNTFRTMGVSIWLDDFGTGYSSLLNLRDLPISGLKVDRTFVSNLETDLDDFRIVSAIVSMANSLGLRVVAEGVETETQAQILSQLGCDALQGYLIGRPAEMRELVATWSLDQPQSAASVSNL